MQLPLATIRVLDLTLVWAGPSATMVMADWGAEVIRVEPIQVLQPGARGAPSVPRELPRLRRSWGAGYPDWDPGERPWNRYPIFQSHARNKLSMTLDLERPGGLELFHRLLAIADVVIENNAPDTIEKLHVTYEELVKFRPDLIMLRMPAYGLDGAYKNYRSFGVQLESTAGHTWIRGYPDMDPMSRDNSYLGDAAAGVHGAFAVMLALRHRRRTGEGQLIELSQAETFIPYLGETVMDYNMNLRVHDTLGNRHPSMAPHGVYRCQGPDRWVTIAVRTEEQWRGLCLAMDEPSWCQDPRFGNALNRWKHQDELDRCIEAWTAERSPTEVMHRLQAHGVAAGAVLDDRDLYEDPHMSAQAYFKELTHRDSGTHRYPGIAWTAANTPNEIRTPPCRLGEHNDYVYTDLLAVSAQELTELQERGHIGTVYPDHLRQTSQGSGTPAHLSDGEVT